MSECIPSAAFLALQDLEALMKPLDKSVRSLQRMGATPGEADAFVQAASATADAFALAQAHSLSLARLEGSGLIKEERLLELGGSMGARVDHAQLALRAALSDAIQERLQACSWPPPLTGSGGQGDEGAFASGAGGEGTEGFFGAETALPTVLGELQHLLTVLLTVQRAVQQEQFEASTTSSSNSTPDQNLGNAVPDAVEAPQQQQPILWSAIELAMPIAQRLRHHFAEGLPTDRVDKPEWLFASAIRFVQAAAPHMEAFQPGIDAHGLGDRCALWCACLHGGCLLAISRLCCSNR
jgi:hypothetical protein